MKRMIAFLTIMVLLLSAGVVWAEEDHGQDARSQSMSAESGDEPIEDIRQTQDPGTSGSEAAGQTSEGSTDSEPEEIAGPIDPVDEDLEGAPDANAPEEEKEGLAGYLEILKEIVAGVPTLYLAAGGGVIVLILLLMIISSHRSRKRRKNAYRARH